MTGELRINSPDESVFLLVVGFAQNGDNFLNASPCLVLATVNKTNKGKDETASRQH